MEKKIYFFHFYIVIFHRISIAVGEKKRSHKNYRCLIFVSSSVGPFIFSNFKYSWCIASFLSFELIFKYIKGINFHEFRKFWAISRKLLVTVQLLITRKLFSTKWGPFVREKNNFGKYFLIKTLRLDNTLT